MSENENKNSNGKKRNRRRRPNNRKGNRRPNSNNNRGPKVTGFEKVERGYLNLLEKHLESRKKYFALFHRADPRQLAKLEKSFYRTLSELRDYEEQIKPEYKDEFYAKYDGLKHDNTYSENHGIDPAPQKSEVDESAIEDPHLLPSQVNHEFKEDEEESVGSIEDYQRYKGL